jgi:hypothetical protein
MTTHGKLDTIRRGSRHLGVMSIAVASGALLWHAVRERTT